MKLRILLLTAAIAALTGCAATAPTPNQVSIRNEVRFTKPAFELTDVDEPPRLELHMPPEYPKQFRSFGVRGVAMMAFIVDEEGMPREVQVGSASDEAFGEAGKEAISTWRFSPARKNGQPVACLIRQRIEFKTSR